MFRKLIMQDRDSDNCSTTHTIKEESVVIRGLRPRIWTNIALAPARRDAMDLAMPLRDPEYVISEDFFDYRNREDCGDFHIQSNRRPHISPPLQQKQSASWNRILLCRFRTYAEASALRRMAWHHVHYECSVWRCPRQGRSQCQRRPNGRRRAQTLIEPTPNFVEPGRTRAISVQIWPGLGQSFPTLDQVWADFH